MRWLFAVVLLAIIAGCAPGQIFGPPKDHVSIEISSRLPGDTLTVFINGTPQSTRLTDATPSHLYRVEIQVRRGSSWDCGAVYVNAKSSNLGILSRVKSGNGCDDTTIYFEFSVSDFR